MPYAWSRPTTRATGLCSRRSDTQKQPTSVGTLDAIHLATALEVREELTAFVCYDERLSAAAREVGLPVVTPIGSS